MGNEVLPSNKAYNVLWFHAIVYACIQDFSREPLEQNHPSVVPELRTAVKNKIQAQDAKLRESLSALNWTLEDPSAIRLVYGDRPVETVRCSFVLGGSLMLKGEICAQYILQFLFLMSEYLLQIVQACCTVTIDLREWERVSISFKAMRSLAIERVNSLKGLSSWINCLKVY